MHQIGDQDFLNFDSRGRTRVSSALSLIEGVHIVARALLDINLIGFGYIADLSQWGGLGYCTRFYSCSFISSRLLFKSSSISSTFLLFFRVGSVLMTLSVTVEMQGDGKCIFISIQQY